MLLTCISPTTDIMAEPQEPDIITNKDSQLLYGESFQVEQEHGAYVYGHSLVDNYKGYVDREDLIKDAPKETHMVTNLSAHLYIAPTFKNRPVHHVSFLSRLRLTDEKTEGFTKTFDGLWVHDNHVQPIGKLSFDKKDAADIALQFVNTPYLYGGRSAMGLDCSALIQVTLNALGIDCQRDSSEQQGSVGKETSKDDIQRNDIVFFKGHVGIMIDNKNILNATARHMTTLVEPLTDLENYYKTITHIARL